MNLLFLTLAEIHSIEERGIYQDLLRKFRDEGHDVTIVTPIERRKKVSTNYTIVNGVSILQVKTFNIQKTNIIEKGIGTLAIEYQYLSAIKKNIAFKKFDLLLYTTPPITLVRVIEFLKNRDNAKTYLLLKDIFPQNAIDLKLFNNGSFLHRYFLKKEKNLYKISDTIGCMSPANQNYILKHNLDIDKKKVEVNPNSIEPVSIVYSEDEKISIRKKYGIPIDKKVFVYGGNLGKPQGLEFLMETIVVTKLNNVFYLIIGNGTEFTKVQKWFESTRPSNAKLLQSLSKIDYDKLLSACDIGLIFLNKNFIIPNFPSRLLSYLEMRMPVIAATDPNTDIGDIIEEAKCGYKVSAGDQTEMQKKIIAILNCDLKKLGDNAINLLNRKYTVEKSYMLIMNKLSNV
jgi:glycosyltransferase involved in cell wall biosynthesis